MGVSLVFFIIASGFAASAVLYHADTIVRGQPVSFTMQDVNLLELIPNFLFCMFAGPYMLAHQGVRLAKSGEISPVLCVFCMGIVVLWSFCAGVFVAQLLVVAGFVQA